MFHRYVSCQVPPGTLWAPKIQVGTHQNPLGSYTDSQHPVLESLSWQVRGKRFCCLANAGSPGVPPPHPCTGVPKVTSASSGCTSAVEGPPRPHLLPQGLPGGKRRAGRHKPAVAHLALVQVVGADAIHKEAGVLTYVLWRSQEGTSPSAWRFARLPWQTGGPLCG